MERTDSVKSHKRVRAIVRLPLIVTALGAASAGACVILSEPAPSTLPRQAWQWLVEASERWSTPAPDEPNCPLVDVPIMTVEAAKREVRDEFFVVGVELNGETRAYPFNMLSRPDHHVVNDTLGGLSIAVTFCGLCQSPIVFSRRVADKTLTLFVSGELFGENMVMQDVETGSNWPQMLGEAVSGPLEGKSLPQIPAVWTDWKTWHRKHPTTTVLRIDQAVDYYRRDAEDSTSGWEKRYFASLQWGLVREGKARSWPLRDLAPNAAVNDTFAGLHLVIVYESRTATITAFERRIGDAELTFRLETDGLVDRQTGSIWDPATGRAVRGTLAGRRLIRVAGVVSHMRAWRSLYPESEVYVPLDARPAGAQSGFLQPLANHSPAVRSMSVISVPKQL
jgi:hypothetical protein